MGETIIKPDPGEDLYVLWDSSGEEPFGYGGRAEIVEELGGDTIQEGRCPHCRQWISQHMTPAGRLDRADFHGSSALGGRFGWWDDTEFIFRQRGLLARTDLVQAVDLICDGNDEQVEALLRPLHAEVPARGSV